MPIRDLQYPEDAVKVSDSLVGALAYDASIAVRGVSSVTLPPPGSGPIGNVRIRASGKKEDEAVQRTERIEALGGERCQMARSSHDIQAHPGAGKCVACGCGG